jgi:hypothetical protein
MADTNATETEPSRDDTPRDEKGRPTLDVRKKPIPQDVVEMLPSGAYWVVVYDNEINYSIGKERKYVSKPQRSAPPRQSSRRDSYNGVSFTEAFVNRYGFF